MSRSSGCIPSGWSGPAGSRSLAGAGGILVPGGFGERGIEGKIAAARYAREHRIPYFGLCLGMQVMCIEFARNVLGLAEANSTEFNPKTPDPVISLMPDQQGIEDMGGTMRLGLWPCAVAGRQPGRRCVHRPPQSCANVTATAGSSTTAIGRRLARPGCISAACHPTAGWSRSPSWTVR